MSLAVYLAASLLAITALLLLRRPRMVARDPLTISTTVTVILGALVYVTSAPVTISAVNRATGIPNFGAPLCYGVLMAYSCSILILLTYWRGGPRDQVLRMVRGTIALCIPLIGIVVLLFCLAEAPVERLTDLDTYYANTLYMREMIVLYLVGHGTCAIVMCAVCLKWQREVDPLLRTGLRLIVSGMTIDIAGFVIAKCVAVVARWYGHDLDFLSTKLAPPAASLGALLCALGLALPRLLPPAVAQWHSVGDYRRLGPLWNAVRAVPTAPKPYSRWQLPQSRLRWREVSIHDALLALAPIFDDGIRETAQLAALAGGRSSHDARVIAEAAMLADAAQRAVAGEQGDFSTPSTYQLLATSDLGNSSLVELSQALKQSPPVGWASESQADALALLRSAGGGLR
ncbi:MAB_1171c family putative transporter [Streptomyces sp. NPDC002143]